MKQKLFASFLLAAFALFLSGCVRTVDGHHKFGLPAKDKVVHRYERPVDQIFNAARTVVSNTGKVLHEDASAKTLKANINTRTVWIKVTKIDENITEVVVQARKKFGGGDIVLADELSTRIAIQLAAGL